MAIEHIFYHGPGGLVATLAEVWQEGRGAVSALRNVLVNPPTGVFYIGQTNNPLRRRAGHGRLKVDPRTRDDEGPLVLPQGVWSEMHVVFRTDSDASMRKVETQLEDFARHHYGGAARLDLSAANRRAGGAGRRATRGPFYVYVLRGLRDGQSPYSGPGYRGP